MFFESLRHNNAKKHGIYSIWQYKTKIRKKKCHFSLSEHLKYQNAKKAYKIHFMEKHNHKKKFFCVYYVEKRQNTCKVPYMGKRKDVSRNVYFSYECF